MRRPHLKRKTICIVAFVAAVLVGAGLWSWRAWERARDYAKVEVSQAISWQQRKWASQTPASQVTISLETPDHRGYADAEVFVEIWTDDRGTDLLMSELRTSYLLDCGYTWETQVVADGGIFGSGPTPTIVPHPSSPVPRNITWTIGTPVEVSPGATSMRIKGRVEFREGRGRQSVRIEAADVREGESFQLGSTKCLVVEIGSPSHQTPLRPVRFQSSDCQTPWLSLRFVDSAGKDVSLKGREQPAYNSGQKAQEQMDGPLLRLDQVDCPPSSSYAAIIIDYWPQVWTKTIPFDVTVPVTRQTPLSLSTHVQGPTKLIPPPSLRDHLDIDRIPDEAWGPRAGENPKGLVRVLAGKEGETHWDSERLAVLKVEINEPQVAASYDFTVTGFRDSEGNQLFRPRPVRSGVLQYSAMECERYWRSIGSDEPAGEQPYIPSWFEISTRPLPPSKVTSVEFEGFVKLKVMDSFKTLEIENVAIDNETTYTVGPVQLSFAIADDKHHILVFSRGDFGLIRELEFFAQDGTLLHREKRSTPHLYWNNRAVADVRVFDRVKDVKRLRVQYCSDYHHYVLPFKVTVPRQK